MKALANSVWLDIATFGGILLGIGLLVVSYFDAGSRMLAWPALAILLPSLIHGTR